MSLSFTPTAKLTRDLKRLARKQSKTSSKPVHTCLNDLAFEELKQVDKLLLTQHVTYRTGPGCNPELAYLKPANAWELLISESWTLDLDAKELRSHRPQVDRSQETRIPPVIISWAADLPDCMTVPFPEIDQEYGISSGILRVLPRIDRRGVGDYPVTVHIGGYYDSYVVLDASERDPLRSKHDIARAAGLVRLARDMRQCSKDISKSIFVDARADLEMQCADLAGPNFAPCLFMKGQVDGVPGFLAGYLKKPIGPFSDIGVDLLNLDERERFSIAKLSLEAWNSLVSGLSERHSLLDEMHGVKLATPLLGSDFRRVRNAIFHDRYVGPKYVHEEPSWIVDRVPSSVVKEVAAITDGARPGWCAATELRPA